MSTVPLRLNSIQQGGCIEYFSLHHYDNKDVVTQQVIIIIIIIIEIVF